MGGGCTDILTVKVSVGTSLKECVSVIVGVGGGVIVVVTVAVSVWVEVGGGVTVMVPDGLPLAEAVVDLLVDTETLDDMEEDSLCEIVLVKEGVAVSGGVTVSVELRVIVFGGVTVGE